MTDRPRTRYVSNVGLAICALLAASVAGLRTTDTAALPLVPQRVAAQGLKLIDEHPTAAPDAGTGSGQEPFAKLNGALATTRARLEELTKAAALAAAARRELETVEQENRRLVAEAAALRTNRNQLLSANQDAEARIVQLNSTLARAQSDREALESEARKAQDALAVKVETPSRSAEHSAAEIGRLRTALDDADRKLQLASSARSDAEARLTELRNSSEERAARLGDELTTARTQLTQAEAERDKARGDAAELQSEAGALRTALGLAKDEVDRIARNNDDLQQEVAMLHSAANSATEAARQNLLAVESRIKELDAAIAEGQGGAVVGEIAPEAGPKTIQAADSAEMALITPAAAEVPRLDPALARVAVDLPREKRLQVQGLLADFVVKVDPRGLALMVPGDDLFAIDGAEIGPTAHDTLAKVAELIDAYHQRNVMIVGHTDSNGEKSYNKVLSERRANLVKQFLVDQFNIDGARLSTEGRGEDQPIASNATPVGRQVNRRVEVLILN